MKFRLVLFFGVILSLFLPSFAQKKPEWFQKLQSIALMVSTRSDIEKTFGNPENPAYKYDRIYRLKEGKLDVEYSRGLCSENKKGGWNVPEFTVTRIFFDFNEPISPKKMPIDSKGFHKYEISDVPNAFIYENDELGISYSVTRKGKIEGISFYPANKYDHLFCKD